MPKTKPVGPPLNITDRVTSEHGEAFVREWFKELRPMQGTDAFANAGVIEWPDEESDELTEAQKRYNALEKEIMKRTFEPLRHVIAASFVLAAAGVLGRAVSGVDAAPESDTNNELYADHHPEVRALLDLARAAIHAQKLFPTKVAAGDILQHITEAAEGWTWSLIEIIMDYEQDGSER